jgi:hypothetical protein
MSVRPSIRMEQLSSQGTIYREISYRTFTLKPLRQIQVWLKLGYENYRRLTRKPTNIYDGISPFTRKSTQNSTDDLNTVWRHAICTPGNYSNTARTFNIY